MEAGMHPMSEAPRPDSPVNRALQHQTEAIGQLEEIASAVAKKLDPITLFSPEAGSDANTSPESVESSLVREINQRTSYIRSVTRGLQTLHEAIQI